MIICRTNLKYLLFSIDSFNVYLFFSFKILNFETSPKILHDEMLNNFLELSNIEVNPLFIPENIKELRTRVISIFSPEVTSKFKMNTFNYFSHTFLNCFDLNIYNFSLNKFISFYKQNSNYIFTVITNTFSKYNLDLKNYSWIKATI